MKKKRIAKDLQRFEAKTAETEELLRIVGKALDLVPVTALEKGINWMPSDEAVMTIKIAKDRLTEWRRTQIGR